MPSYPEGTVADGPNGPIIMRGGRWVPLNAPQPGAVPLGPRNNNQQRQSQQDALALRDQELQEAAAQRAAAADARAAADQQLQFERAGRERRQYEATTNPDGTPKPEPLTAGQQEDRNGRVGRLNSLVGQINRVQVLGNNGPLSTSGIGGLADYNPWSDSNARFNTAGASLSQQGLGAFRVPGTGTVSDRDAAMFDRANLPQAGNLDAANEEILGGLRSRVEEEYAAMGLPPPQWEGLDNQDGVAGQMPPMAGGAQGGGQGGGGPNGGLQILDYADPNHAVAGQQRGRVASGALLGPEYRDVPNTAIQKRVTEMYLGGASFDEMNAYVVGQGYPPLNPALHAKRVQWDADYKRRNGGRQYRGPYVNAPIDKVKQTTAERVSQGAPGAAGIGYTNAASFGAVGALAPEQMQMSRQAHPYASAGGEIAGVFTGLKLGGGLLGAAAGRSPMAANALSRFRALPGASRNLAADASYGTVRGAVENPDDPLYGAVTGGGTAVGGSVLGSAAGRTLGAALGGVKQAPGVRTLLEAGVPLTTGQRMGGLLKGIEDRATSLPVVGDMIGRRRVEGLEAFDLAARNEAGRPIGATFQPGGNWIDDLPPQFDQAYTDATAGVTTQLDSTFKRDMGDVLRQGDQLPPDYRKAFEDVGNFRVTPAIQGGTLTGAGYQQAMRGLKAAKGKAASVGNSGFEDVYRESLGSAQDALKGQMIRNAGPDVIEGLQNADRAYGMAKTLQKAQQGAVNGTQSGTPGIVTPAQLNRSAIQSMRKFGNRPFAQLAEAGQNVLPSSIPNSGTADRLAQIAGLGALGGAGGAGAGYANGGGLEGAATGAGTGLVLASLLAAGGSKPGQAVVNAALFKRPEKAKSLGALIRKKRGLFGTASVPLMLEALQ